MTGPGGVAVPEGDSGAQFYEPHLDRREFEAEGFRFHDWSMADFLPFEPDGTGCNYFGGKGVVLPSGKFDWQLMTPDLTSCLEPAAERTSPGFAGG
jgi:hypothetical protein